LIENKNGPSMVWSWYCEGRFSFTIHSIPASCNWCSDIDYYFPD